jgi:hypothetical protein
MKYIIIIVLVVSSIFVQAQTNINKTYTTKAGQKLILKFDYPNLVKVTTWDKNEVAINAKVKINDGENDNAFVLEENIENGTLTICNKIKDRENLPKRYIIKQGKDKMVFKTKAALEEYMAEKGKTNWDYWGGSLDIDITLEIMVPANIETELTSTYGMVELKNFKAPIQINAPYGGIDASLVEQQTGSITATTKFGKIYSNLNIKVSDTVEKDFYTSLSTTLGKGPSYTFNSTYGKVYLRKQ